MIRESFDWSLHEQVEHVSYLKREHEYHALGLSALVSEANNEHDDNSSGHEYEVVESATNTLNSYFIIESSQHALV